jgi:hypothetical protein
MEQPAREPQPFSVPISLLAKILCQPFELGGTLGTRQLEQVVLFPRII